MMQWRRDRGVALGIAILAFLALAVLIAAVTGGLVFLRRAHTEYRTRIRAEECRAVVRLIVTLFDRSGGMFSQLDERWTAPCESDAECARAVHRVRLGEDDWAIHIVPYGEAAFRIWAWRNGIPICRADRVRLDTGS